MDAITTTTTSAVATATRLATADRVDLDALAHGIAGDGIAAHTPRVLGLVLEARELGVDADLVAVLADDAANEIARMRAFGYVATSVEDLRSPLPHPADILSA
jgi:hypothetical protein